MYSLMSGLWKYYFQKDEFYVLILGLDNAGKTTYLEQTKTRFKKNYVGLNPSKITATVGLNIGSIDKEQVRLNFWDLGGQQELQALWDKYYAECHAVVYMIDSADTERISESLGAFDAMISNRHLEGVPLLVVANKQDVDGCNTVPELKSVFSTTAHRIGKRDCSVMASSALQGTGITEGIDWLVTCVQRNSLYRPPKHQDI